MSISKEKEEALGKMRFTLACLNAAMDDWIDTQAWIDRVEDLATEFITNVYEYQGEEVK